MSATFDRDQVYACFQAVVNMAPVELEEWLAGDESRTVGFKRWRWRKRRPC